ncbi:TPA: hypothetical protein HA259_02160, partial [Thermoplasmata archaeon]|nr:hypothetical protein [Thermoplasmata archaeon]
MNEKGEKRSSTLGREAIDLQEAGMKTAKRIAIAFRNTWKIYRRSKTGVAGLAIVFGFFFVAFTAQWIAPYDSDFKAPAIDTFEADYATRDLPQEHNWSKIVGLTSSIKDRPLERIMIYSSDGSVTVFPVTYGINEETGLTGIDISSPAEYVMPEEAEYLNYAHFYRSFFFVEVLDENGVTATLYEYDYEFSYLREHDIPFVPIYTSNLWNGFSPLYQVGRLALAFADEHNVWLISKRPPEITEPGLDSVTYINNLTITGATIVGNPLVVAGDFSNASTVIVPTEAGIMAYDLNLTG